MKTLLSLLAFSFVLPLALRAELKLPAIISDHMVLQQNQADPIWGWDTPGTKITVFFAGQNYPATTATDPKSIKRDDQFTCTLATPVTALAVRVIGKPACGNKPKQSFSSCAGLAVYER